MPHGDTDHKWQHNLQDYKHIFIYFIYCYIKWGRHSHEVTRRCSVKCLEDKVFLYFYELRKLRRFATLCCIQGKRGIQNIPQGLSQFRPQNVPSEYKQQRWPIPMDWLSILTRPKSISSRFTTSWRNILKLEDIWNRQILGHLCDTRTQFPSMVLFKKKKVSWLDAFSPSAYDGGSRRRFDAKTGPWQEAYFMLIFIFPSALHKTKDVLMNGKKDVWKIYWRLTS